MKPPWTQEKIDSIRQLNYKGVVQFFIKEYVLASDAGRCAEVGNVPCNWRSVRGYIFVATIENGRPLLKKYTNRSVVDWTRRVIAFLKKEIGEEESFDLLDVYTMTAKKTAGTM